MPVVSEYEPHAITERFGYATSSLRPFGRDRRDQARRHDAVRAGQDEPQLVVGARARPERGQVHAGKGQAGPVGLAAVARSRSRPPNPPRPGRSREAGRNAGPAGTPDKKARIAVIGDSDFIKNRYYGLSGNGNFFLNVANWLTEEADLIAIQPKTRTPRTIQLTPSQGRLIFLASIVLLPLAVLVVGVSVWARRRSL